MTPRQIMWAAIGLVAVVTLVVMVYEPPPKVTRIEAIGEPTTHFATQSCHTAGFCMTCGIGFDGEMSCGFKMSPMCPGKRRVSIEEQLTILYYEDGTSKESVERKTTPLSSCRQT